MAAVEFYFDFNSPYSYLASTQVRALARRTGATLIYKPMVLGAVFKDTANQSPALNPAKAAHYLTDLDRWARRYGVPFIYSDPFPLKSISALRVAVAAGEQGKIGELTHAAFDAHWGKGVDISQLDALAALAAQVGLDPKATLLRIQEQDLKDKLRANTDEAVKRGAFGAPTFYVGQEMFWGNDRLSFVEEALAAG